ncbi:hypothetical protein PY254_15300 [Rhodanobacter sp. AS-Z3]|uniref:hypothetical protein n=1 Tax=Rhodanobacter sp. AS-Z3 TaxID=3031330 RepID=UPI002478F039|nr:hypothetical protein [Rhodanobacter sp. AS-Z3]WEN14580.1 hypothetical protein PY254_15300 [Rhodanobacter sp. AS-Z3]
MHTLPPSARRGVSALVLVSVLSLTCASTHAADFTFGGKLFADISQLQQNNHVAHTQGSAPDADLKRLYLDADYAFDPVWSAHLTTDINWLRGHPDADFWIKHLYVQRKFGPATVVRVGVDDMPLLAFNSQWYGYRYVDSIGTSMQKIDSVADWGVHLKTRLAPTVDLAVSVVSGGGYKEPTHGHRADVEALLAWHTSKNTVLALGGYDGQLAANDDPLRPLYHTARRIDLMAAYADDIWRFGARYAYASNWANLYTVQSDRASNWSSWASLRIAPRWSVFARYDYSKPNRLLTPSRKSTYADAGVEWKPLKKLRLALVLKHNALESAGNLMRTSNEAGLWTEWAF